MEENEKLTKNMIEVIKKAMNFSEVRKMEGYDDRAHKSAGWYLSEAVKKLKNDLD